MPHLHVPTQSPSLSPVHHINISKTLRRTAEHPSERTGPPSGAPQPEQRRLSSRDAAQVLRTPQRFAAGISCWKWPGPMSPRPPVSARVLRRLRRFDTVEDGTGAAARPPSAGSPPLKPLLARTPAGDGNADCTQRTRLQLDSHLDCPTWHRVHSKLPPQLHRHCPTHTAAPAAGMRRQTRNSRNCGRGKVPEI